jgi:hypothetical protein
MVRIPMRPKQVGPSGILYTMHAITRYMGTINSIAPYNGTGMMFQVDPIMGTACDCWCNWCDDKSRTHTHAGTLRRGKCCPQHLRFREEERQGRRKRGGKEEKAEGGRKREEEGKERKRRRRKVSLWDYGRRRGGRSGGGRGRERGGGKRKRRLRKTEVVALRLREWD